MSGDVQPRKRKDKKRKKDDIGGVSVDEPHYVLRGTAAALGEGDVFMHSYHEHGTGGHWCAKVIFFSLLAILVSLIGLIILENRGLSELEANSVQTSYSGVLEGWLEDTPDDDHHDVHTLELKHHDDDHDTHGMEDEGYGDSEADDHDEDDQDEDENDDADENDDGDADDEDEDTELHGHDDDDDDKLDDLDDANDGNEDDDDEDEPSKEDQEVKSDEDVEEGGYFSRFFGASNTPKTNDMDDDDYQDNQDEDDEHEVDDNIDNQDDTKDEFDEEGGYFSRFFSASNTPKTNDIDDDDEDLNYNNDNQDEDDEHEVDDSIDNQDDTKDEFDDDDDNHSVKQDDDYEENEDDDNNDNDNHPVENDYDNERHFFDDDDDKADKKPEEDEDADEDDHDEEEDEAVEVEKIEREAPEHEEPISTELTALPEDDDDDKASDEDKADTPDDDDNEDPLDGDDDDDFLDADPPPVVERITAPAGKPFQEIDEEDSSERPPDTLEEEEEYEKKQEELRREEEQASSHMWTKLCIGVALLAATCGLVSRASAPRDSPEHEENVSREETPVVDRRMTLIPEESEPKPAPKKEVDAKKTVIQEVVRQIPVIAKTPRVVKQESEDEEVLDEPEEIEPEQEISDKEDPELYSDEDFEEEEVEEKKEIPKTQQPVQKVPEIPDPDDEVPDDVEIIDDDFEEELLEEEEEISDVDDAELLTRLEAKYGRLPEPHRPGQTPKDGGNSAEEWAGEPSDPFWRQQLDSAERELRQGKYMTAAEQASAPELMSSARARWIAATALDRAAETERDNRILSRAIAAYLELLKMNERLSDEKLVEIAKRTLNRILFRADLAETQLKETLLRWPNDRVSLAHYGFVLKTLQNKHEEAVEAFEKALQGDTGPACEPRYYYHYGDALLLLGRFKEAHEVHKRAAKHGHFLSPAQRSLYNVKRLKGKPWWNVEETPYLALARALESNWRQILKEGQAAKTLYEQEKEGLRERGEWSQLDLFVRGREIPERCKRAPVTCAVVKTEVAAVACRRGQIKFSSMEAGTHVRPHVGPTNCRLRMHLGLSNTKNTYIRVDQEIRQWREGKVLLFDDSFEHEVWHNGTGTRLVLIVDVWHPQLTPAETRQLPAI